MRALPLALALLLPLACGSKDDTSSGDSSGTGGAETDSNNSGATEGVTEAGGATEVSGVSDGPGTMTTPSTDTNGDTTSDTTAGPTSDTTGNPTTGPTTNTTSGDPTAGPTTNTTSGDPTATGETTTSATTGMSGDPSSGASDTTGGGADEGATKLCVDTINMYRATLGLPALQRWSEAEDCSDAECLSDGMTQTPHGAFGMCGESAQNECPGWPGPPENMITGCLELMWNEGPGEDFSMHGHYINMSNPDFTRVACGFAEVNGQIWAVQNFQ